MPQIEANGIPPDLQTAVVCTTLMRLGTHMATIFDQRFSAMGITQASFRTLLALCELEGISDGGIAPSRLADYLLIDRATVTVLVSRLIAQGAVERLPGPNRRTHRLRLTPAGQAKITEVIPSVITLADETLAGIPPEDLSRLLAVLTQTETRLRGLDAIMPRLSDTDTDSSR